MRASPAQGSPSAHRLHSSLDPANRASIASEHDSVDTSSSSCSHRDAREHSPSGVALVFSHATPRPPTAAATATIVLE
jgi:hypothetical protein